MVKPVIKDTVNDMLIRKKALEFYAVLKPFQSILKYIESDDKKGIAKLIKWDTWGSITIIPVLSPGFQLWPRDGVITPFTVQSSNNNSVLLKVSKFGGWYKGKSAWVDLLYQSAFPMFFDPYLGTFTATVGKNFKDESVVTAAFNGGSMGNFYWTDGDRRFLNWDASPNRHFVLDKTYTIPGVTNEVEYGLNLPFNEYIYQGGVVLARAPQVIPAINEYTPNYFNLVAGAFYQNNVLYCVTYVLKNNTPQPGIYEEIYKSVGAKTFIGEIGDKGWQFLNSRLITTGFGKPYFISTDGVNIMAPDGVKLTINSNGVILGTTVLAASGSQSYTTATNSMYFTKQGTRTLWPELDDKVTVAYSATSDSSASNSDGVITTKVPLYLYGIKATGVEVQLGADTQLYERITGSAPPIDGSFFTAFAKPNGMYCDITWSAAPLYGCTGPSGVSTLQGDVRFAAGTISTSCSNINFRVTASTESNATGYADYSTKICGTPNNRIIQISANTFTYDGQITSSDDTTVTWTVSGATISGSIHNQIVILDNVCPALSLQVSGKCGTISQSYGQPTVLSISGTDTPTNGSQYSCSGAVSPLIWTISQGTINASGVVSGINTLCGSATITVTDRCGQSASKTVRLPIGVWLEYSNCSKGSCTCGSSCTSDYTTGDMRYVVVIKCCLNNQAGCVNYCGVADPSIIAPGACLEWTLAACNAVSSGTWDAYFTSKQVLKWVCP